MVHGLFFRAVDYIVGLSVGRTQAALADQTKNLTLGVACRLAQRVRTDSRPATPKPASCPPNVAELRTIIFCSSFCQRFFAGISPAARGFSGFAFSLQLSRISSAAL